MKNKTARPVGRPTTYTQEVADIICKRLATGRTLRDICRDDDMPAESSVREWAATDREGFFAQYAKARESGYHAMADEVLEIADDGTNDWVERSGEDGKVMYVLNGEHVQRSRLRVDSRKWLLSKALPKIYGDKLAIGGDDDSPLVIKHITRKIVEPGDSDSESLPPAIGTGEV
jgi:hypothetical protein